MAASMKFDGYPRQKCSLLTAETSTKDHPLHVFISRQDATKLGVPSDKITFYISIWTNTTPKTNAENESVPVRPQTLHKSSIFQRMLSGSQNFPEILQPESSDVDVEQRDDSLVGSDVEIFAYAWIANLSQAYPDNLSLHCSEEFRHHYNIYSNSVYIRQVTAYPVSSITVGVGSHETFQWLTNNNFSKRLLSEVSSNTVLIRAKDVFLAPYGNFLEDPDFKRSFYFDMYILECAPVQQGLITVSTEMILTYMGDLVAERNLFHAKMESILSSPEKGRKAIAGPFKDTLMSDFSLAINQNFNSPEIREDKNSLSFKMKADARQLRKQQIKNNIVGQFLYEVVQQQSKFKRMLWRDNRKQTFDPMYYVGMSRKSMIKLGLFHSSYVLLTPVYYDDEEDETLDDSKMPKEKIERLCMIKCLGKEYDKSKRLFISPLCLFNMIRKPPVEDPQYLLMKRYTSLEDHNYGLTSSQSWSAQIPEAREVHISIIPSPNYSPRAPHDEALNQYFSVPRIVSVGDVLAIRSSDDPQFWQNTGDDTENRFPCIYFKVVRATGPETSHGNFLLKKDITKLIQIGTDHSYIPVMMQIYLNPTPQGFWDRDLLPGLSTYVDQLESFIMPHLTSKHGCKSLNTVPPAILVAGPVGCGKTTLIVTVARRLGVHAFKINCHALVGESSGATEARMKNAFTAAGLYSPCILLLQSIHAIGRDRDATTDDPRVASSFLANVLQLKNDLQQFPMIVVATCHSNKDLTHDMLECFLHQVCIEVPTELERADMFDGVLQNVPYSGNLSIPYIAQRTAGFVLGDMAALIAHAKREAFRRVLKLCCSERIRPTLQEEEDLLASGIVLQQVDFQTALDQLQAAHSDAIGAPKIPNVTWDDVGGLMDVKSEILDTIQLPLQYPELLAAGLRRSGVLLYGPPGTGKTLLAKAVATECSLNFLSVKGPELINMYVGQSEENVREVFRRARSATPCVIFFDELDSLAPNRGKSGDSGGVMDRVVSQLLAELDGLNKASDVFVIGATNRPDLLDPALLRPGRFDKLLYLGVSEDNDSQMRILSALTRKFNLSEGFQLESVIEQCPFTLTGADFYALSSDAMLNAVKRKIQELDSDPTADQTVTVSEQDFFEALDKLTPSVSQDELHRFKNLQQSFEMTSDKTKKQTSV